MKDTNVFQTLCKLGDPMKGWLIGILLTAFALSSCSTGGSFKYKRQNAPDCEDGQLKGGQKCFINGRMGLRIGYLDNRYRNWLNIEYL